MKDVAETFPSSLHRFAIERFLGLDAEGAPLVSRMDESPGMPALSLVPLKAEQAGARVAVAWLEGEPSRPLVLGLVQPPAFVAEADGDRVVIEGRGEVVLRCGKASITLKPDGSITIRGGQILSRADGANRVQGASVHLN
jgi:hypothetical protein